MTYLVILSILLITFFKIPPHWSILIGITLSLSFSSASSLTKTVKNLGSRILQLSIILLGASLNFHSVIREGMSGLILTFFSISIVFLFGHFLARFFGLTSPLSTLITAGTSICGGSAISAISPVLKADSLTMATALGIVFILNAVSVFIFPPIAHFANFTQLQFGTWAALAIHDTSSVVAASQLYGEEALKVGATLKLTRALWIIPLSILFSYIKKTDSKMPVPWFILFFMTNSILFTFISDLHFLIPYFSMFSKTGLSLTLFLVGLSLNKQQIKQIGKSPVFFGLSLWIISLLSSFFYVKYYV